jgi:hypothetical protein
MTSLLFSLGGAQQSDAINPFAPLHSIASLQ